MTDKKDKKPVALLNVVDYDKTIKYELRHPNTGERMGVFFKLTSQGSSTLRDISRKQLSTLDNEQKGVARIKQTESLIEARLAACIVGWEMNGAVLFEGDDSEPEFNEANKLKIVQTAWIFDQLNKQVNDIANFTNA